MPAKVVKVTGLPSDATEESLADFFSFHGKILRTRVVDELGWLEFSTASEAKSSLLFDRTTFLGAKLRVSESDVDWSELPEDDGNESPPSRSEASSESYDVVERPPAAATPVPPPAPAPPAAAATAAAPPRSSSPFACFSTMLAEPINSPAATIGITVVGLAVLAM
jgi:hypothetical protein